MIDVLQILGWWAAWTVVWLLCAVGLVLSCLSLSGTWLATAAAAIAVLLSPGAFPGWWVVVVFALVSVAVELVEWGAGAWGVAKRGGSRWAGVAAVAGGLLGMIGGTVIPLPVVGSLLGMMVGSFLGAFAVEHRRLKHAGQAADIAWGAVMARILVILVKVLATLAMIGFLAVGVYRG